MTVNEVTKRLASPDEDGCAAAVMPLTAEGEPSSGRLVGRDRELAALLALLDPRLDLRVGALASVVVSGMAGVGKTALAAHAARAAVRRGWFPGGALVIDLHGYDPDPAAQVPPKRVYASLLRTPDPSLPVAELPATVEEQASAYHHLLSQLDQLSRPVLLVLEGAGSTDQVTGLLPAGRAHRVLITSRLALGELPGARRLEVDVLASELAVELLGARRPGDTRLGADPAAAAALVRLCGHLPLALRIIAVLLADDPARPQTWSQSWPRRPLDCGACPPSGGRDGPPSSCPTAALKTARPGCSGCWRWCPATTWRPRRWPSWPISPSSGSARVWPR